MGKTMERRFAQFLASGDLILDLLKAVTDLPEDAELVVVEEVIEPFNQMKNNVIRFIVNSSSYPEVSEGNVFKEINPCGTFDLRKALEEFIREKKSNV